MSVIYEIYKTHSTKKFQGYTRICYEFLCQLSNAVAFRFIFLNLSEFSGMIYKVSPIMPVLEVYLQVFCLLSSKRCRAHLQGFGS